jgi:cell division septation protein DedD
VKTVPSTRGAIPAAATRLVSAGVAGFLLVAFLAGHALASLQDKAPDGVEALAAAPLTTASTQGKSGAGSRLEEIRRLARRGLLDSAYARCRQAMASGEDGPSMRFLAAKLAPEGKVSAGHFKDLVEAGRSGPEKEESLFRLGQYYYAAGRYHLAIPSFRDYVRNHPKGDWKEPAHYWMGSACLAFAQTRPEKSDYLDTGLVYFRRLLDQTPSHHYYHPLALEGIAKIKVARGEWREAWEAAQAALVKAPEDERASILLLAAQLGRSMDRQEESRLVSRLAAEHPASPEVRHLRKLNGNANPRDWRAPALPGAPTEAAPAADGGRTEEKPATEKADLSPEATATKVEAHPKTGAGGETFTLQLGAFSQPDNARGLVADLARLGFKPEVKEAERGDRRLYQVRLGRFATVEEALEFSRLNLLPRKLPSQPVPVQ